jgi:hypothetical protein
MKLNKPELTLNLLCASLLVFGRIANGQSTNQSTVRPEVAAKGQRGAMGPVEMMKQSLNLSDEQAKKLEPVLKEQQKKLNALRRDTSLSRKDRVAKLKELQQGTDAKIKPLLTAEQTEKWQKMRLGQGQAFQVRGQGSAKTNLFSLRPQAEKGQQGLPTWQGRIAQPQASQQQPAQQATPK